MMDESHSNSLTQAKIMSDIESIQDLRSIAHQTLKILQDGTYVSRDDEIVSIKQELSTAVSHTFLYTPEEGEMLLSNGRSYGNTELPIVKITQETTQDAVIRLKVIEQKQDLLVLNFASARNPGGGFLNGAMAQEESLSRCSGLYQTLLAKPMFMRLIACNLHYYIVII